MAKTLATPGSKTPIGSWRAQWVLPTGGVNRALPAQQLDVSELYDALNLVVFGGEMGPRKGLALYNSTLFPSRPIGAFSYLRADNRVIPILATQSRVFTFDNGWTDRTDVPLVGSADIPARMTVLPMGTPTTVYLVLVNGLDVPRQWDGSAAKLSFVAGSPPVWTDVTTAFDRIVGIVPPYEVSWGEALSLASWSTLNRRQLADTPDPVVAISNLGTMGVCVYKSQSIWTGLAQGGPSSQAFRFELVAPGIDGPANPAARVRADLSDFYMTTQGRIGAFDGQSHEWIADGVWPLVQADLDTTATARIHGWYDPTQHVVWFAYPRVGDQGECYGLVLLHLPQPKARLEDFFAIPGRLKLPVSAAVNVRLADNQDRVLVFGSLSTSRFTYTLEGADDAGTPFDWMFQTGLVAAPNSVPHRVEGVEPFVARGSRYGDFTLRMVVSDILDAPGGTVQSPGVTVDLTTAPIPTDTKGFRDARGRFFGLRGDGPSTTVLRYVGAILTGRPDDGG